MSKYACRDCDTTFTAPTDTDTVRCPGCGDMVGQQPAVSSPPPDQTAEPVCLCGHPMRQHHEDVCLTECGCQDGREPEAPGDLPGRLEAALTARFTESGNPFSRMRIAFQGPDGWPASKDVGPHDVALVLRELLAAAPPAAPSVSAVDQTTRDRIADRGTKAEALLLHFTAEAHRRKWNYDRGLDDDGQPIKSDAFGALHRLGDEMNAALHKLRATPAAVLPPPADRAAIYREVADRLAADAETGAKEGFTRIYRRSAAKQVREWAEELPAGPASQPPADRAAVLRVEAALVRAHCPDHLDSQSAEGSWINCHCDVADDMERRAAEAQAAEHPSLYAQSGVDTPSCDCGHDGMGMRWHREPCAWLAGLAAEAREVLAKDDGAEAQQPDTETRRPALVEEECCGAEPPTRADDPNSQWGDCWCTLPPGHDGEHSCQPCTERHGAPGWTDAPAVPVQPAAADTGEEA